MHLDGDIMRFFSMASRQTAAAKSKFILLIYDILMQNQSAPMTKSIGNAYMATLR